MNPQAERIIRRFGLEPHPEGGYFKETYRSIGKIPGQALERSFDGERNYCTAIYFLLAGGDFSAFHRLRQDEIWHFYSGSALYVHVIHKQGDYLRYTVGPLTDPEAVPQLVVPAGCWFASSLKNGSDYAFVGCTVAPGFDFADFELGDRKVLQAQFPRHKELIERFTRI